MREKWKRSHDLKLNNLLGMKYQTAKGQLERQYILYLAKKAGMGDCFQCGFEINSHEDMSIEHKIPWARDTKTADLFWDMENLALSHKWCNCSAGCAATGKHAYIGIHNFIDRRHKNPYIYIRAEINVGKQKILGYYDIPEEGAIAYDIGVMVFRKGISKLNFEKFREEYIEKLKEFDITNPKFFNSRGDTPINNIVTHFIKRLADAKKVVESSPIDNIRQQGSIKLTV